MKQLLLVLLGAFFLATATVAAPALAQDAPAKKTAKLTDKQIRKLLIQASIDDYPGNCPCPYNLARNGSRCGKRSAWSKPGGHAPLCYDRDVTKAMVEAYRDAAAQSD